MRYSYVIHLPYTAPYDKEGCRWFSYLGNFVKPIADKFPDLLFWSTYYNDNVRFRLASEDQHVHDFILSQIHACGFSESIDPLLWEHDVTLLKDLGHSRFIDQSLGEEAATRRANLALKFLCSASRIMLDSLNFEGGGYWNYQKTPDKENPFGNNFESLVHLVANISRFQFALIDGNRTEWMVPQKPGNTILHL